MAGLFITIEGIEGAGKTTIAERLQHWLEKHGHSVFRTREPGGTPLGESLRSTILNADIPLCVESELLLIEAARAQLMHECILPKLQENQTVILDRHIDSTTAYQGYGRNMDRAIIQRLNEFTCRGIKPDMTLLLDIDVETGLQRARKISEKENFRDRFESEQLEFMTHVRKGFLQIAEAQPRRVFVFSAHENIEAVWENVLQTIRGTSFFPL